MKLLVHNGLSSNNIKHILNGYPLKIIASKVIVTPVGYNPGFVKGLIDKLNWRVFYEAAKSIDRLNGLPEAVPDAFEKNEEFLKKVHHTLLEVEIVEGFLECPETGRIFPIENGLPNMLLSDDECK